MPKQIDTSRYAHNEGHTDICFDENGSKVLTCGADGDVRIWENIDDDDAVSHRVGEKAYCITCKDGKYYTAVDSNTITAHTVADGSPDGIVTRFTAPANHMVLSEDGTQMLAGASDFHIKLVKIGTSQQKTFTGHEAPILSVALDPKGEYAASSSCDGTVKIWQISDTTCVKTFSLLPKCNDVSLSKTLCRLCWSPKTGKYLVVPGDKEVLVYERDTWEMAFKIVDKSILQLVNVVEFSPNGQYLAVACVDGSLSIWDFAFRDCLNRMQHENKHTICSLAWNPRSTNQIMFCDNHGQMGVVENAIESEEKTNDEAVASNDYDSLFAADDDDLLLSATAPISKKNIIDSEDDDSESVDLAKLKKKHSAAFGIMDEDSRDTDAQSGMNIKETEAPVYRPAVPEGPKLTPLQRPFQSGSSPLHLSERYMVWNNTGIVRQYNTEDENSIDIEFHDTATHHAMHMGNTAGHTMADMSSEAVILACEADPEEKTNRVESRRARIDNGRAREGTGRAREETVRPRQAINLQSKHYDSHQEDDSLPSRYKPLPYQGLIGEEAHHARYKPPGETHSQDNRVPMKYKPTPLLDSRLASADPDLCLTPEKSDNLRNKIKENGGQSKHRQVKFSLGDAKQAGQTLANKSNKKPSQLTEVKTTVNKGKENMARSDYEPPLSKTYQYVCQGDTKTNQNVRIINEKVAKKTDTGTSNKISDSKESLAERGKTGENLSKNPQGYQFPFETRSYLKKDVLSELPESVLTRPEYNTSVKLKKEIDELKSRELTITDSIIKKATTSKVKARVEEKVSKKLNAKTAGFRSLTSVEVPGDEFLEAVAYEQASRAAQLKSDGKAAKTSSKPKLSPPDLMEFFSSDLQKDTASWSLGEPPKPHKLRTAPFETVDIYRHIRCWENL